MASNSPAWAGKAAGLGSRSSSRPSTWPSPPDTVSARHQASPSTLARVLRSASALIAGLLPINEAAELTNIGILLAFIVVCCAVIVLRHKQPSLPRTFRCPWVSVVPITGIVFSVWLISFLGPVTWLRFAGWFALGLVVYVCYGRRHSFLHRRPQSPEEHAARSD